MQMTQTQKRQFFEEGYLIVRGAIPKLMVEQARKAINHHMGSHAMVIGHNKGLSDQPAVTDLFNKTPLWGLCESVVGEGKLSRPQSGNTRLRFPQEEERFRVRGHLDLGGQAKRWTPESKFYTVGCYVGAGCAAALHGQFLLLAWLSSGI